MTTKPIKKGIWLATLLLAGLAATAQSQTADKIAYISDPNTTYDRIHMENGVKVEWMQLYLNDRRCKAKLVNDKMTELFIDDKQIPAADWEKHSDVITAMHEQIKENKLQTIRNREQAVRNEAQAKRNEEQAVRNQGQEKKNQEQAVRNEEQAKRNAEQAVRNQEQVQKNQEQAHVNQEQLQRNHDQVGRDSEQMVRNREQAARNEEQAARNKEQIVRNQQQAVRNTEQAKRNEVQAAENEKFMKSITADLVNDKIIGSENDLHELTVNDHEMIVNGVKQPDAVYQRYSKKYSRFSEGQFMYSMDGTINGN
jgi:colicin import membrane protein